MIDAVLPLQLDVLRRLRAAGIRARAAVSAVSPPRAEQIRAHLDRHDVPADVIVADNASLLAAADLVLVASGTATLEVAYRRKPMIVLYDAGRLLSALHGPFGGLILKTPHLSLVNILAGRRVVPEFMPAVRDLDAVTHVAGRLLTDESWRRLMIAQIEEVVRPLEASSASANVCRIIADMLAAVGCHGQGPGRKTTVGR